MAGRLDQLISIPRADLTIPRATIGTMMFGSRADATESKHIVDVALDRGFNVFDTANMYNDGESERLLGRALKGRRDRTVVATKVGYGKAPDGSEEGLSRQALMRAIDGSLSRLGMDVVDIYYLHRPDYATPIEETLSAMADIIEAGKVRHFGISNFAAWKSADIVSLCEQNDWPPPVIAQMIHNMLVRQIEYEYVSFCRDRNLHLTIYNPLAGGLLTGKYRSLTDEAKGGRFVNNPGYRNRYWSRRMLEGAHGLQQIADDVGVSLTHMALNWVVRQNVADSILLGPSTVQQLEDCLAADESELPAEAMGRIADLLLEFDGTNATYAR